MQFPEIRISLSHKVPMAQRPTITSSREAYNVLLPLYPQEQIEHIEFCYALFNNSKGRVIGYHMISKGGIDGTQIDVRVVLQLAILANATSLVISHNHPSGNLQTSHADEVFTKRLRQACDIMNITLVDHVIVTPDGYFSFADEGKLR